MTRAVDRGLKAKRRQVIPHLGVDEKSVAKRHRYVTLVGDVDRGTIEFVSFDRKKGSLDAYYQSLSPKQLAGIRAVAIDMWEPYISSTLQHVPDAANKIVFDRFLVMKHMLEAVDSVRRASTETCRPKTMTRSRAPSTTGSSRRACPRWMAGTSNGAGAS